VTTTGAIPRLVVAHYYTYSLYSISEGVWLALDTEGLERLEQQRAPGLKAWKSDTPSQYPHYKDRSRNPYSTNGYYDLSADDPSVWPTIEKLSLHSSKKPWILASQ